MKDGLLKMLTADAKEEETKEKGLLMDNTEEDKRDLEINGK